MRLFGKNDTLTNTPNQEKCQKKDLGFFMQLCAPLGLFFLNDDKKLIPVAIQLYQGKRNPVGIQHLVSSELSFIHSSRFEVARFQCVWHLQVFTPDIDKHKWILVKMWFNLMEGVLHQMVFHLGRYVQPFRQIMQLFLQRQFNEMSWPMHAKAKAALMFVFWSPHVFLCVFHPGFTHLVMEGIAVAVHRCLSKNHPIFRLLAPHFIYLMAIKKFVEQRRSKRKFSFVCNLTACLYATEQSFFSFCTVGRCRNSSWMGEFWTRRWSLDKKEDYS